METGPPSRSWTSSKVFVLTILVGVSVVGCISFVTNYSAPTQQGIQDTYAPYEANQTSTQSAPPVSPPSPSSVPPLPLSVLGVAPPIDAEYDGMPFSGEQGSYCWTGNADAVQNDTGAPRTCQSFRPPTQMSAIPTIAVYPNATIGFQFPKDSYPGFGGGSFVDMNGMNIAATLFDSGSMKVVRSNSTANSGFALGVLPVGGYILAVNATWARSYTLDYFGVQQIASVNFTEGPISIAVGSPSTQSVSMSGPAGGSSLETVIGPDLETWPLTLSSPTIVKGVNLTASSVISGNWVKFLPSYLPEVGPNGTSAEMLLNGAVRPFVKNDISNVTMIIRAIGDSGATGEVGIPIEGSGGSVVIHSLASGQQFETPTWSVTQGQKNFNSLSLIYDPPSAPAGQSLPVLASIAGLYEAGGVVAPLPSWLQFSLPAGSTNVAIAPYSPSLIQISTFSASSAQIGGYTLVIDLQIGGATLTVFAPVVVVGPIFAGPA